jgi:site-specific recombinase XerD
VEAKRALARVGLSVSLEEPGARTVNAPPRPVTAPARAVNSSAPRSRAPAAGFATAAGAYLEALRAGNRSPATVRLYDVALRRFVRWVEERRPGATCGDLDHALADAFVRHLRDARDDRPIGRGAPLSDRTVHQYAVVLKLFARWGARGRGYWTANPLADYEAPRFTEPDIVPYSREELAALLDASGSPAAFMGRRLRAMLLVALDTGLRRGELRRLTLPMVDATTGRVRLPAAITKTRRPRTVHLQRAALDAVRAWLAAREVLPEVAPDRGPLFCGLDGAMLADGAMDRLAARLRARSGVVRFHWHLLRHTAGTESLRNGADSLDVQETLGHTTSAMTRRYLHLTDDDRRERHARYSPVEALLARPEPRERRFRR